jgi:5,10-methenyltetrahydrofolate synthetase
LRRRLLDARARLAADAAGVAALGDALRHVLGQLEPRCLGLYWPVGSEFNAPAAVAADRELARVPLALPYARRRPDAMHYRAWDGTPPVGLDECRIACCEGPVVVPDVVVVPCVGYTDAGFRLGYGGGYFDRWLGAHREVCAVGVAWSATRLSEGEFMAQPHDVPLALIVTERGVV